jgi:hypothetical protein
MKLSTRTIVVISIVNMYYVVAQYGVQNAIRLIISYTSLYFLVTTVYLPLVRYLCKIHVSSTRPVGTRNDYVALIYMGSS